MSRLAIRSPSAKGILPSMAPCLSSACCSPPPGGACARCLGGPCAGRSGWVQSIVEPDPWVLFLGISREYSPAAHDHRRAVWFHHGLVWVPIIGGVHGGNPR